MAALREQLQAYLHLLRSPDGRYRGPITVVVSGHRPRAQILGDSSSLVTLDGRPEDLGQDIPSAYMPLISQHYRRVSDWRGWGRIPPEDQARLQVLAQLAHAEGKQVRLWATPERSKLWQALLDAGIDLVNTDELAELDRYLRAEQR
jgi:hypothetical protein